MLGSMGQIIIGIIGTKIPKELETEIAKDIFRYVCLVKEDVKEDVKVAVIHRSEACDISALDLFKDNFTHVFLFENSVTESVFETLDKYALTRNKISLSMPYKYSVE